MPSVRLQFGRANTVSGGKTALVVIKARGHLEPVGRQEPFDYIQVFVFLQYFYLVLGLHFVGNAGRHILVIYFYFVS